MNCHGFCSALLKPTENRAINANTPPLKSRCLRPTTASPDQWDTPVFAGITPWPRASSRRNRRSSTTAVSGRRKHERATRLVRGSKTDTTGGCATAPSTRSALSSSNCNTHHNQQRSLSPPNPVSTNRGQGHADRPTLSVIEKKSRWVTAPWLPSRWYQPLSGFAVRRSPLRFFAERFPVFP